MTEKLTPEEIKKALECCVKAPYCSEKTDCPYKGIDDCVKKHTLDALDLINRQQAQIDTMLEDLQFRTNQVIEQQAEIEKLNAELVGMRGACNSYKMHYDNAQAEIERLRENNKAIMQTIADVHTEAIKEFAERLKLNYTKPMFFVGGYVDFIRVVDNLVKEMVGEDK